MSQPIMAESAIANADAMPETAPSSATDWPVLPTETEIYILPDGRVVVADLPAELVDIISALGTVEPCAVAPASVASDTTTG